MQSTGPLVLAAGLVVALWIWFASVKGRQKWESFVWPLRFIGFLSASFGFWCTFQLLGKFFSLATSWPLIGIAIAGGLAVEIIVWLYAFEKSIVTLKRGRLLLALRLAALVTLLLILLQPVRSFLEEREINREVAILVDDSESMRLADQRLTTPEVLDRAQLFDIEPARARPNLSRASILGNELATKIRSEVEGISSAPNTAAGLENRAAHLPDFFKETIAINGKLTKLFEGIQTSKLSGDVKNKANEPLKKSRDGLARVLPLAQKAFESQNGDETVKQLNIALSEVDGILQQLPALTQVADQGFFDTLNEADRKAITEAASQPRDLVARQILNGSRTVTTEEGSVVEPTLLDRLKERYNIRMYRFARDVEDLTDTEKIGAETETESGKDPALAQTDLSGALEHVLENSSPESLAGILLLSDGRHNTASLPEDSLRQLAVQSSPLSAIPIGGNLGPIDISFLSLNAPESIYLDDRVVVKAEAKLDGLLGKDVKVELLSDGKVVEDQTLKVSDVNFRTEVRFVHTPEEKGIHNYQIRIEPDEREIFKNNNSWDFKVAVTDDRTNVLLVDNFPRWEFRYLRNLFYGRDKSVHLQYVLLNPDEIDRSQKPQPVAASATRKFGDAEATTLPETPEEWQLFDVIILGDIPPSAISTKEWRAIEEAVTKRGALLVCIAGPRFMPHGHNNMELAEMLPITFTSGSAAKFESPEDAYSIALTTAGRGHPVTSQSTSRTLNVERWNSFPKIRWRYQSEGIKEGAEVLAYALPEGDRGPALGVTPDGSPGSVEAAIERLANQKDFEAENALITTIRAGLGKVLMMNFDRTWRFRYGVGDTYHHRFWGQVTRWGSGSNLRSGNEITRLGTDRLSYTPSDPVQITAKILDTDRRPITDADVFASVFKDDKRITRQKLSYRSDSSGIYETTVNGLTEEGEYSIKLEGDPIDKSIANNPDGPEEISTELLVVTTRNPIELAELTADRDFLNRATQVTNGKLSELWDLDSLVNSFGPPREILKERRNVTLWDKWPFLIAFLGLLTTEWVVRRRSGLV